MTVNGESVEKKSYSEVVHLIQATGDCLQLVVVPKQDDVLQIVSYTVLNISVFVRVMQMTLWAAIEI